jgi:hypothetical protein
MTKIIFYSLILESLFNRKIKVIELKLYIDKLVKLKLFSLSHIEILVQLQKDQTFLLSLIILFDKFLFLYNFLGFLKLPKTIPLLNFVL